jgi:hypothetical protein
MMCDAYGIWFSAAAVWAFLFALQIGEARRWARQQMGCLGGEAAVALRC